MSDSYSFSFPAFIKGEFLTKLNRVNKKLAGMANANQVQILSEELDTRKILKPEAREKILKTKHLGPANVYKATPEDYMDVVFSTVEVSLPVQTKINGFNLVGTINIEGDVKTIHALDDSVNLSEVDVKLCHHCGTKRKRKCLHVFVEESSNDLVAIGSTCVFEYIGLDIDRILHTFFNFYKEDDLYGSRGMRQAWGFPIENLANATSVAYAMNSTYVKAGDPRYGEYNESNTKSRVDFIHSVMFQPNQWNTHDRESFLDVLKTAPKVGKLLSETYGDLDEKSSNFNSNIVETLFYTDAFGKRVLRDFIVGKARGLFVWACFNALNKAAVAKVQATQPKAKPSFHVGKVGDRISVSGTVKVIRECNNSFGSSRLVVVKQDDGAEVKTFSTSKGVWNLNEGDSVQLKGTVSQHDEYKGTKSTMVKRASFS
jgi:hypothetical protein